MRRLILLALSLTTLLSHAAATSASVIDPRLVSQAWTSRLSSGTPAQTVFTDDTARVYAQFRLAAAPHLGAQLAVEWYAPNGTVQAVWTSRIMRSDHAGTRLWSSVARSLLRAHHGRWLVVLRVDRRQVARVAFSVTTPPPPRSGPSAGDCGAISLDGRTYHLSVRGIGCAEAARLLSDYLATGQVPPDMACAADALICWSGGVDEADSPVVIRAVRP